MPRPMTHSNDRPRVLLLAGAGSYRRNAFVSAAKSLDIDVVDVIDIPEPLEPMSSQATSVDYNDPERACREVADLAKRLSASAILAIDDSAALVAAMASHRAGIPHNEPDSVLASRDKLVMRQKMAEYGAPVPWFQSVSIRNDPKDISAEFDFPCVVKPTRMSGSRGVIRADDEASFETAFKRTRDVVIADGADPNVANVIIEQYLPGLEVAVEGILSDGNLTVLAVFDKPDPLEGPFFEETIYVTPSRLPAETLQSIAASTDQAAKAIGIKHGPVHAELRINEDGVWVIEIAGRSIGGMCSTVLEFGTGQSLEEIILLNATGGLTEPVERSHEAAGVMMIPIPRSGVLRCVDHLEEAKHIPGIADITISAKLNAPITALPEGSSYLGFIFARGDSPDEVEAAIRASHERLSIKIDPMIQLARAG